MKFKSFMLFIILSISFFLNSQDNKEVPKKITLDVENAVNLALANNLDLKSEKLRFQSTGWSMYTSWNVFVPRTTMSGTVSRTNLNIDERTSTTIVPGGPTGVTFREVERPQWSIAGSFNLSLDLNVKMFFQIYQTVLDFQTGKVSLEVAKNNITKNVKTSFYNLILLQKKIDISIENMSILEKRYQQAQINYRNGFKSEFDLLSAQVDFENSKPDLMNLQNQFSNQLLLFKQLLGLKTDVQIDLNAQIESDKKTFNSKELIIKYLKNNLDIKQLNITFLTVQNAYNLAFSDLTPTFNISYSMDPTYQYGPENPKDDPIFINDPRIMNYNWRQSRGALSFTVTLPISSLFPFGREQVSIIKNQYNLEINKLNFENKKRSIEIQIESLVDTLERTKQTIDAYKKNVNLAERAYKKAEEAYNAGYKDLLDVQTQENSLRQAKFNLLNAEFSYTQNILELENALNTKLK